MSKTRLYSSVDVSILHKDWCGQYSPQPKVYGGESYAYHSQLSETDFFTQIYVALIGLSGVKGFIRDGSLQPQGPPR